MSSEATGAQEPQPLPRRGDPRLPAVVAVVGAVALYVTLPNRLTLGPAWVLPGIEAALLAALVASSPYRHSHHNWVRWGAVSAIAVLSAANIASLVQLTHALLHHSALGGSKLFFAAIQVYVTNMVVFSLWFWELDRGGPVARLHRPGPPDFLFPQMMTPDVAPDGWQPGFVDYTYVALTNATAFSPTDTMPLTAWAKTLMGVESIVALLTVSLVAARAVNILS